jgi:hypothetical protein
MRPTYTESTALSSSISIISNKARAAGTLADVGHVLVKMTQLIHSHKAGGGFDPIVEYTLHIQLAILFLRHGDPSNAGRHC